MYGERRRARQRRAFLLAFEPPSTSVVRLVLWTVINS
jgi:hypothetical protein